MQLVPVRLKSLIALLCFCVGVGHLGYKLAFSPDIDVLLRFRLLFPTTSYLLKKWSLVSPCEIFQFSSSHLTQGWLDKYFCLVVPLEKSIVLIYFHILYKILKCLYLFWAIEKYMFACKVRRTLFAGILPYQLSAQSRSSASAATLHLRNYIEMIH
jgi:hypothetical protein